MRPEALHGGASLKRILWIPFNCAGCQMKIVFQKHYTGKNSACKAVRLYMPSNFEEFKTLTN